MASEEESKRSHSVNQAVTSQRDSEEATQPLRRGKGRARRQLPPSIESLTESEQEPEVDEGLQPNVRQMIKFQNISSRPGGDLALKSPFGTSTSIQAPEQPELAVKPPKRGRGRGRKQLLAAM